MKTLICVLAFLTISTFIYAQTSNEVGGIVFDKDTKFRLNRVEIINKTTNQSVFNSSKAEFFIKVKLGDILISSVQGYKSDTLKYTAQNSLIIYLKRLSIRLPDVIFKDSVLSAKAKYEQTKKDFNTAVTIGNNKDLLTIGQGGAGLGIAAIWSAFSKEGKNARKLMEIMERDYQNALVDQIFNRDLVYRVTGLKGDKLLLFMINYRPSYLFAVKAKEYDLVNYIKIAFMRYQMNPNMQDVSKLKPIELN